MIDLVLRVSAEGGEISLLKSEVGGDAWFSRVVHDQTPLLIGETSIEHESEIARSWADAIRLLDQYPWHRLSPRTVHPTFRARVWDEISRRANEGLVPERKLERWREKCGNPSQTAQREP